MLRRHPQGPGRPSESSTSRRSPSSAARSADSASPSQHGPGRSEPSDSELVRVSTTSIGPPSVTRRRGAIWACRVHGDHQVCRGPGHPPVEIMVTPATMVTDGPGCDRTPFREVDEFVERGLELLTDGGIRTRVIGQPFAGIANCPCDLVADGRSRLSSQEQNARHPVRCGKELGDRRHGFGEPGPDLRADRRFLASGRSVPTVPSLHPTQLWMDSARRHESIHGSKLRMGAFPAARGYQEFARYRPTACGYDYCRTTP